MIDSLTRAHTPAADPVMVEAGHYTLAARGSEAAGGEVIDVPGLGRWWAGTSETTRRCVAAAAEEIQTLRAAGRVARLGLMVGDLALPAGKRASGAAWGLPATYQAILRDYDLSTADVVLWGEAACRNLGRRRLLDMARHRHASGRASYATWGWALLQDGDGIRLVSDASLDWEGDVRTAVLTRGPAALCPLVFAGLKEAIFRAGFGRHVAIYARADDVWIDLKLRAAAAAVAQLRLGDVGEQVDRILVGSGLAASTWLAADLVAPGERTWPDFLAEVREHSPGVAELEYPCPPMAPSSPPACGATKTTSPCSG